MGKNIKKIGVLTSGGDAPGMNACIRAVVRTGIFHGIEIVGIMKGYQGLIDNEIIPLPSHAVSNIIQRGGTILKTARCQEFRTPEGRQKAFDNLQRQGIDALIVIGGDGTFSGAEVFSREFDIPVMGIPGTIDNDLFGTDFTIGFDTANNSVIQAIDQIRDTAASHNRLFFVEVMGRDAGVIALWAGVAGGSEAILIPEKETAIDTLIEKLAHGAENQKSSSIVVVAEGEKSGGALKIAEEVKRRFDHYDTKVTVLGHLQRGGSPTCFDRVLASRMGYAAVKALMNNVRGKMIGMVRNKIQFTELSLAISRHSPFDEELAEIATVLSI
ncbi:MAG: 6-phosphofructokinase [Solitalea sp.]